MSGQGARDLPPDELRCTVEKADGSGRCRAWAARRRGLSTCAGHAKLATGLAQSVRSSLATQRRALKASIADAEARAEAAEQALGEVDPFDPSAQEEARLVRYSALSEAATLRESFDEAEARRAVAPPRDHAMIEADLWWVKRGLRVEDVTTRNSFLINGSRYVWEKSDVRPTPGLPDRDVDRRRQENMEARDEANGNTDHALRWRARELRKRYDEVTGNGYALLHRAGEAGMTAPEYLAWLQAEMDGVWGRRIDLNDDMPEWEDTILPAIQKQARRGAWRAVGALD